MQMCHLLLGCVVALLLLVVGIPLSTADDVIMQKRQVDPSDMERLLDPKRKRPFCNAFTGCGKKRSDESMGTLVELNSEPAVAELSRQILSEAKLWEAIQEARQELLRRKQQEQFQQRANSLPEGPVQLPISSFRKRRSVVRSLQPQM
ncbi:cardioactive peptide [Anabrus simplex]|uniref:cardioactive peptide n=1 Tax=Anabrus simplex TaxID=316456 RepID=UPI0035A26410